MTPVSAFVTFESEEGYQRALHMKNHDGTEWLDMKMVASAAPEPTDIIWENRYVTNFSRLIRLCFVIVIILVLLAGSFSLIVAMKQQAVKNNTKYQQSNCRELYQIYTPDLLKDYAMDEYQDYYHPAPGTRKN